jgi:chromatin segregation and condensation protein Rec8/ScpA/Scc1 (kleisin family)
VIETEKMLRPNRTTPQTSILPPPSDIMPQFDIFIAELELQMDKLYSRLTEKVKGIGIIDFSTLTKGLTRMESIRTIIYLLFLAQNGKVSLWQDEQTEELYIAVGDLNFGKIEKPSIND